MRWPDFESLGRRISQQVILGAGRLDDALDRDLARVVRRANLLLRDATAFAGAFPAYVPSALMLRRAAFARVGPFDTSYRCGNDSDWILRATDAGEGLVMLPDVLFEKRVHAGNQGHDVAQMKHDLMRVLRSSIQRKRAAQRGDAARA